MPGLFGLTGSTASKNIIRMLEAMNTYPHYIKDSVFINDSFAASRMHLGKIGEKISPLQKDNIYIWIEGEAYNIEEVARTLSIENVSMSTLLIEAEKNKSLTKVLKALDGYYCGVIYNKNKNKVKLFSDRYGMRFLYWYHNHNIFAWGSSVKAILAIEEIETPLDEFSFKCFMHLGYMMGEHTWFKEIRLIKPASIIEYDIISNTSMQYYYWKWSEIEPIYIGFDQAVNKLGELFISAISKRFAPDKGIGISLSGGLDSRAILAVVDQLYPDYRGYAYTFGIQGCDDIEIAKQVASKSNWQHKIYTFTDNNWLLNRIPNVLETDGMLSIMHMHGVEFLESISCNMNINLNGYAGDAVLGGSFLTQSEYRDKKPEKINAEMFYGKEYALQYEDSFFDIKHFDHYLLMNRVRRFTNMGTIGALTRVEQRKPFFDNDLMGFIYSIPDSYRANNKLYSSMLQKFFPKFFKDIPWQRTGKPAAPIQPSDVKMKLTNLICKFMRGLNIMHTKGYTNYSEWIREPEIAQYIEGNLCQDNAMYKIFTQDNYVTKYLTPHLTRDANNSEQILRALTIELYLSSVLKYKDFLESGNYED